jgi:hypothetical protein
MEIPPRGVSAPIAAIFPIDSETLKADRLDTKCSIVRGLG